MGGRCADDWHLYPEHEAVLIGTQDMLLSRALNRGYGCARGRWPMEYAQLHHDALWVLDEVQLMGVGLATSCQLQAFRKRFYDRGFRPAASWWMSATLQPSWLATLDHRPAVEQLAEDCLRIPAAARKGALWAVEKPCSVAEIPQAKDKKLQTWGAQLLALHNESQAGPHGRVTLAIANTVDRAVALYKYLHKQLTKAKGAPELRLVHSRFRGHERASWRTSFLNRDACSPTADRIVVATQVVEAGVDMSATTLVTELAPWSSLVQRFGRAARYGGSAKIVVVDRKLDAKSSAPYEAPELAAARRALDKLTDVSPRSLEAFEERLESDEPELLAELYLYAPDHILTPEEYDDLFDTGPDLTGADIDISRFIREGDERDVLVFWDTLAAEQPPPITRQPSRNELCRVPVKQAKAWLFQGSKRLHRAYCWDYLEGAWVPLQSDHVYPGQTILVDATAGGYNPTVGFDSKSKKTVSVVDSDSDNAPTLNELADRSDRSQGDEGLSETDDGFRTIATHGAEVAAYARELAAGLDLPTTLCDALDMAGRAHDLGKAHPAFQHAIKDGLDNRVDLAKAPNPSWRRGANIFGPRRGFRHELASTLALFEWLHRIDPHHPALLGPHRQLVELDVLAPTLPAPEERLPTTEPLHSELAQLDAAAFNLVAYLVCCHHGKVRATWQATPHDLDTHRPTSHPQLAIEGVPLRGICEGDRLPEIDYSGPPGTRLPSLQLHLDPATTGLSGRYGQSWTERTLALRSQYGPHALAYLETLLRVADIRASAQIRTADPLLAEALR